MMQKEYEQKIVLVAGGDLRQVYLANALAKQYTVYVYGFAEDYINTEEITNLTSIAPFEGKVDYLVLPLPVSYDAVRLEAPYCTNEILLRDVLETVRQGGMIFGGKISREVYDLCENRGFQPVDYLEREEFAVLNAIPTAEGALQIAMEELPVTLNGIRCLLTGFGRITKVLVKYLTALGADVTVTARKYSDLSWAEIYGCRSLHISQLDQALPHFDLIINTVPAMLFHDDRLALIRKNCLVIDLASKPGGVDFDLARSRGLKVIWALSLPGKVAPVTSGEIIANTIQNILSEKGERPC